MENKPNKLSKPAVSTKLTSPPVSEKHPTEISSTWEKYLTGKKTPVDSLLSKVEADRVKYGITIPDEATKARFAEALVTNPERIARLLALLQACASCRDSVRQIVMDLSEISIKRLGIISFPDPLNAVGFRIAISSWLGGIRKKPIKQNELNLLFLVLQFGLHRQFLDRDTVFNLVASAVSKPVKLHSKHTQNRKLPHTQLEVLLSTPSAPVLSALLSYAETSKEDTDDLKYQIQNQAADIARLTTECVNLNAAIADLNAEVTAFKDQNVTTKNMIAEAEKQIMEIRDGYQHKLDELRGRIRGMLQGQFTRWLQTALDASRSDPPWTQAIQERLEDSLKLIEKELQWLQPSA
jgi:hypothetical protein